MDGAREERDGSQGGVARELVRRFEAARRDEGLVVVEGFHALKHALRFGAEIVAAAAVDPEAVEDLAAAHAPDLAGRLTPLVAAVDEATFRRLAPRPHPTGVIALARRPAVDVDAVLGDPAPTPFVLLDQPAHQGNIGAVVRVAAAAGAAGVLVTGAHDPWHPSAIRGGAGLQFAVPVGRVASLPPSDRPLVALDPEGEPLGGAGGAAIPPRAVLAFGSERRGLGEDLVRRADLRLSIPMRPGVSSLNLATAVAVTLYATRGT